MSSRPLTAIAKISLAHPRITLLGTLILTAAAAWSMSRMRLSVDILELVPKGIPVASKLRSVAGYGSIEPVIVAISGTRDNLEDRIELAQTLRKRLSALPGITSIQGGFLPGPWSLLKESRSDSLLLYLSPDDIYHLAEILTTEKIEQQVALNRRRLYSSVSPLTKRLIAADPLGVSAFFRQWFHERESGLRLRSHDGILLTEDGFYALLLVRLEDSPRDLDYATRVLDDISEQAREALKELNLSGSVGIGRSAGRADPLAVGLTGHAAIVVDYRNILAADIRKISALAFLAVLLLFLVAFRRPSALIIAGVPLIVGVTWTLGLTALVIGQIDALTAGSVPILCGLAIDLTIHLYNRYLEEIGSGHQMTEAFTAAYGTTGTGVILAALTTTWAFLSISVSHFPGARNLGLICAMGMPLCLLASLWLVPVLTSITNSPKHSQRRSSLAGFGLDPVLRLSTSHPRTVLFLGALCILLLATMAKRTDFEEELKNPSDAPSRRLLADISDRAGLLVEVTATLVAGTSAYDVLEGAAKVEEVLDPLTEGDGGPLAVVLGPARLLPTLAQQQQVLDRLRELRSNGVIQPERVEGDLLSALTRNGFRVGEEMRRVASRMAALLSRDRPISVAEAQQGPIAEFLNEMLIERDDGSFVGVIRLYPRAGVDSKRLLDSVEDRLETAGVQAELVGSRVLNREMKPIAVRDAKVSSLVATVGILALLLVTFHSRLLAALIFLPVLAGALSAVGLMALFSVDLDLVSVSMIPVILGIGIDDGIHIVHRFLESPDSKLAGQLSHTARGVVLTSLTSIVGFGSMTLADYPGMVSAGYLVIFGVGATLVTAVTFLPAALCLNRTRR